ncbi:hypothetical protein N657DRAFT_205156 [Parathielavia appendiculata]|uniref:Uncharacterized protein n=1 Tax=Parathielavia appendiculata TaxID=2587402 RepID=A0AAN6Z6A5_9PEZI|nr:hypothetical protein N657DRAFT_205156 [Parathielavia appendiculata]
MSLHRAAILTGALHLPNLITEVIALGRERHRSQGLANKTESTYTRVLRLNRDATARAHGTPGSLGTVNNVKWCW